MKKEYSLKYLSKFPSKVFVKSIGDLKATIEHSKLKMFSFKKKINKIHSLIINQVQKISEEEIFELY